MNLIIAQFAHISPNSKIFREYLESQCKRQKIDLVVLGEYVANHFFKEYHNKGILKREFELQKAYFSALSKEFGIAIVAPLIECAESKGELKGSGAKNAGEKIYKSIAIFRDGKVRFYRASRLMDFPHWNEVAFFDNEVVSSVDSHPKSRIKEPIIFSVGGFKVSAIFGWEAHFDEIFINLRKKGVDILCIPTASSFGSNARWQRLLQTRSFLNNCFIVRVNRTGNFMESSVVWDFYGESFIALPDGSLGDMMGARDGILVSEIRTEMLDEIKDSWRFR